MIEPDQFYTFRGYELHDEQRLTSAMEDYLEMVYRLMQDRNYVRIRELSEMLHVKPSSASKMISNLKDKGYISFQKYGNINLTIKGQKQGQYLLFRHEILEEFLCLVNKSSSELEQVEKIEHFINEKTINNLKEITRKLKNNLL